MKQKYNIVPIEQVIQQAILELSDKYRIDYDTILALLRDYDNKVARFLSYRVGAQMLFGVN
jgi:hypothetical protein